MAPKAKKIPLRATSAKSPEPKEITMNRAVRVALENKYEAIVDVELALNAKLTGTSADDSVSAMLDILENEADALNAVLDDGGEPSIDTISPADAEALQNAINKAENAIKQTDSVQSLMNAAAILVGTIRQSTPTAA
jgi:hypothetical protein